MGHRPISPDVIPQVVLNSPPLRKLGSFIFNVKHVKAALLKSPESRVGLLPMGRWESSVLTNQHPRGQQGGLIGCDARKKTEQKHMSDSFRMQP